MILSFFDVGASTVSSEIWSEFSTVLSSSSSRERLDSEELGVAETSKTSQLFSEHIYKPETKRKDLGQENINPFSYKS